jgi:hypothetical protein
LAADHHRDQQDNERRAGRGVPSMKRIIATRLLLVEGASPPDLAIARPVNQASGSRSILWLD